MESSQIPDNFDDIKSLEWKYLQMLSKRNGLKSNQKKAAVIEQLGALFGVCASSDRIILQEGKLVWFSDGVGVIALLYNIQDVVTETKDKANELMSISHSIVKNVDPTRVPPPKTTMSKEGMTVIIL